HTYPSRVFSNPPSPPESHTLSLHDALPISTNVSANPVCQATTRGLSARPTAKTVQPSIHQPIRWCRYAERWKYQGFCSWIKNARSEEHTSELQSHLNLVCRLLLEKKKSKR